MNPEAIIPKVCVYIPCYNAKKYLKRCLEAISRQTYPVDEIVVINDGSVDGSAEEISGFSVKLIHSRINRGLAATRNVALGKAKHDFVAAIDADCVIDKDWLLRCMEHFNHPQVAAVGGKLEGASGSTANAWREAHLRHHWGDRGMVNPIFLSGSNVVIRKDVFTQVGFYDEKRYRNNYEDVDISLRLKKQGFKLIYEPRAVARHLRSDGVFSVLKTYWSWKRPDYKQKYVLRIVFNLANTIKLAWEDVCNKKFSLIVLDCLTFVFTIYFDLEESLRKTINLKR